MNSFFKNKRIFVTGHTGFKGNWLINLLLRYEANVVGYSNKDEKIKYYKDFCETEKVKNYYNDILNYNFLKKSLLKFNPEIIFHLAAQSIVSDSIIDPKKTFETNIIGTVNILEISRELKNLKGIIIVTSDKCYENNDKKKFFNENDKLGGKDPYSGSKAAAEIVFKSYYETFYKFSKTGVASVRAGNVIGGGDFSKNRILPDCYRSLKNKKKLIIKNPSSTRPWQHVMDVISGYLILAENLCKNSKKYSGSWNFGPNTKNNLNVKSIVEYFYKEISTKKNAVIYSKKNKNIESKYLALNSFKANKKLNWKPKYNINEALLKTANWYKYYLKGDKNIKEVFRKQIIEYENL